MAVFQSIRNLFYTLPFDAEPVEPAPPTSYSVRPLTLKDMKDVLKLNLRCFVNGENYTKHTFSYLLNDPQTLSYRTVTASGEMAGFLFVMMNPDGSAHITTIGVAPEHRRRGVAKMLIEHLHGVLLEKQVSTVVLEVRVSNTAAQELYRNAGYTCVQRMEQYYNNGEDGYLMMRSLN